MMQSQEPAPFYHLEKGLDPSQLSYPQLRALLVLQNPDLASVRKACQKFKKLLLTTLSCTCAREALAYLFLIFLSRQTLQYIQTHMSTRTTILLIIARTQEPTLFISDVFTRGSSGIPCEVELVTTPTLTSVLNTSVVEIPTSFETFIDSHVGAVIEDLVVKEAAG